jgi:hypothetical protein
MIDGPGTTVARGTEMQTIRVLEKTGKDGTLSLRIPLGQPDMEYEVVVVLQSSAVSQDDRGWPPGYFRLAGSIDDETFMRPPQGELPKPVEFE